MKNRIIKIISLIMAIILISACLGVSALAKEDEISMMIYRKGKNNASESYMSGRYYKQLTSLPHTGDSVTDLIAVAFSQLGYMESDSDGDFSGQTGGSDNYTEFNYNMGDFGVGYGSQNYDWCASFVSFCLLQSGATAQNSMNDWCRYHVADEANEKYDPNYAEYVWREVGCQKWADNLISAGYYKSSAANGGDYSPQTGDLIFFRWSTDKSIGHIGIVVYSDSERVYTIEGNTSGGNSMVANGGGVHFKSYEIDYSCIDGYGVLPYTRSDEVEKIDYTGKNATTGIYISTVEKSLYTEASVESSYITLPANTMFEVVEIVEEGLGGMLRAVCTIDGNAVQGYIVNSEVERLIQLTTIVPKPVPESFLPYGETDGFISGAIEGYTLNGETISKNDEISITGIGRIVLSACFDFESDVVRSGYFLDGKKDEISWVDGCVSAGETAGTERCETWADMYGLSDGTHTISFVFELDNGVIPIADTLAFTFAKEAPPQNEDQDEPPEEESDATEDAADATDETDTTEQVSDAETEAQSDGEPTEKTGCGSTLDGAAVALVALLAIGSAGKKKNRE